MKIFKKKPYLVFFMSSGHFEGWSTGVLYVYIKGSLDSVVTLRYHMPSLLLKEYILKCDSKPITQQQLNKIMDLVNA